MGRGASNLVVLVAVLVCVQLIDTAPSSRQNGRVRSERALCRDFLYEGDQETSGHPTSLNQTDTWRRCHGYSCKEWDIIKGKLAEIKELLNFNATDDDTIDGDVWLTSEMADALLEATRSKTNPHHRQKRKLHKFGWYFITKWPLPILYTFDTNMGDSGRETIRLAISHWEAQTCIRFEEREAVGDDTRHIRFTNGYPCASYIGRIMKTPQPIQLSATCLQGIGVAAHEIGHAIGFWHEHQRSDRDDHTIVHPENLRQGSEFASVLSILTKGNTNNLVPYDYGSIMHYHAYASSDDKMTIEPTNSLYIQTIGQKDGLSFLDAKLANLAYCKNACHTPLVGKCLNRGYQDPNNCTRCRCPAGFGGLYCDTLATPVNADCGGYLNVTEKGTYVTSPGYSSGGQYVDNTQCNWMVQAPHGYRVVLQFTGRRFGIVSSTLKSHMCLHYVEVRYVEDRALTGPRFCGHKRPDTALQSADRQMLVLFRANFSSEDARKTGFKFLVRAVRDDGTTAGIVTSTNNVTVTRDSTVTGSITAMTTIDPNSAKDPASSTTATPETENTKHDTFIGNEAIDVAFVLDSSGSVGRDNWHRLLAFVGNIVGTFRVGLCHVQFGVVSYGNHASLDVAFNSSRDQPTLQSEIAGVPWKDGGSNTSGGLWVMKERLFSGTSSRRVGIPRLCVLVTTAPADRDREYTGPMAAAARDSGIVMAVVGVTDRVELAEIDTISSTPHSAYGINVSGFTSLNEHVSQVNTLIHHAAAAARSPGRLPESPALNPVSTTNESRDATKVRNTVTMSLGTTALPETITEKWQLVTKSDGRDDTTSDTGIKSQGNTTETQGGMVKSPGASTTSPEMVAKHHITTTNSASPPMGSSGVSYATPQTAKSKAVDVAFLLDSSGSVGKDNWRTVLAFVKDVINNLVVGPTHAQFAAAVFSTQAYVLFYLGRGSNDVEGIGHMIDDARWLGGWSNMSGGIRLVKNAVFSRSGGDRPSAPNVCVLVTDGPSNRDADRTVSDAARAKGDGINMVVVGVTSRIDKGETNAVASSPADQFEFLVDDFSDLTGITLRVVERIQTVAALKDVGDTTTLLPSESTTPTTTSAAMSVTRASMSTTTTDKTTTTKTTAQPNTPTERILINATTNPTITTTSTKQLAIQATHTTKQTTKLASTADSLKTASTTTAAPVMKTSTTTMTTGKTSRLLPRKYASPTTTTTTTTTPTSSLKTTLVDTTVAARHKPISATNGTSNNSKSTTPMNSKGCADDLPDSWACDFENGSTLVPWCELAQDTNDNFDWTRQRGSTPSRDTGPRGAQHGAYYIYIEASNPRAEGDNARLFVPRLCAGLYCLTFHYNMFGFHTGSLSVAVQSRTLWSLSGPHGKEWLSHSFDVTLQDGDQVAFVAVRGREFSGDIAVDNIRLVSGSCGQRH
ncbi:Zinc metalloproteinase dpy-31 [Lamellibrachia satsuma]|nr:Zinc metalloproteinase dpy-31 [Lamellibrachia satsuma]